MTKIHREGLTALNGHSHDNSSFSNIRVNVIFIHGLRGHPRNTWQGFSTAVTGNRDRRGEVRKKRSALTSIFKTAPKRFDTAEIHSDSEDSQQDSSSAVFWPQQYLIRDVPEARIWTYGYNANVVGGLFQANNRNSISQHGRNLAVKLERDIENDDPLIFVAHSLGGIVVKDAIRRSEVCRKRTKLVVFLGTPHRGSLYADWGKIASNLARIAFQDSNKKILQGLEVNSEVLDNIHEEFKTIVHRDGIKIHSFQESHGLSGIKGIHEKVVDDFSSKLDLPRELETVESIDANHSQMTKFCNEDDSGYRAISAVIKSFIRKDLANQESLPNTAPRLLHNVLVAPLPDSGSLVNSGSSQVAGISSRFLQQFSGQSKITAVGKMHTVISNGFIGDYSNVKPGPYWVVPYTRNRRFIDREQLFPDLLSRLSLTKHSQERVALFGLGGVGKSQIALEYAYRHREEHPDVSIFWIHAGSRNRFQQGLDFIAQEVGLPGTEDPSTSTLTLVKAWLSNGLSTPWLMIIDNADDSDVLFGSLANESNSNLEHPHLCLWDYLPQTPNSAILFTTRNKQLGLDLTGGGDIISVAPMQYNEAKALFMSRLQTASSSEDLMKILFTLLEYLPLAIVQAAASIDRKSQNLEEYLELYEETDSAPISLLSEEFKDLGRDTEGKNAVFKTWSISFDQIRKENMLAADLLSLMSFYERQSIPKSLLQRQLNDLSQLEDALAVLKGYSLIFPSCDRKSFDMHRLVQLCAQGWLQEHNEYNGWAETAITRLSEQFPNGEHQNWHQCAVLLPHARRVLNIFPSTNTLQQSTLQFNVAWYLNTQGQYAPSEAMHNQAIEYRQRHLGKEHPDTLMSSNGLAEVILNRGRYKEAEQLLKTTLEIRTRILGPQHKDTLTSASDLSVVMWTERKYDEAEKLHLQVIEGRKRIFGPRHKDTMESIANQVSFLWYYGKYNEAATTIEELVRDMDETLGANHPSTLTSKSIHGTILDVLGQYKLAERLFSEVLLAREAIYGKEHPSTLDCLEKLSWTLEQQGRLSDARQMKQRILTGLEKALGKCHPATMASYSSLGSVLLQERKLEAAENILRQVFDNLVNTLGEDHADSLQCRCLILVTLQKRGKFKDAEETIITMMEQKNVWNVQNRDMLGTLNAFADVLQGQRKLDAAEQMYQKAINTGEKLLGKMHPDTLMSKMSLANVLLHQTKYEQAEQLCQETLMQSQEVLGEKHPRTLKAKHHLSYAFYCQCKYTAAVRLQQETLLQRQNILGAEHPDTLTSKNNMANILLAQCKYEQSEKLYRETLLQRQKILGGEHPDTIASKSNLANILLAQRKYEQSEKLHRETLLQRQKILGEEHPDTIASKGDLADVLLHQCKYEQAEQLYQEALVQSQGVLGEEHPNTLSSKNSLANMLYQQRKYTEAEKLHRETLLQRQKILGEEHPYTLTSKNNLANILLDQHRYEQAEKLYQDTLAQRQRVLGEVHPDTLTSKNNLANVLDYQCKFEEAEQLCQDTLAQRQRVLGEEHPDALTSKNNLAGILFRRSKYKEAEKIYRETLAQRQKVLGEEHPNTLTSKNDLARVLHWQCKGEAEDMYQETLTQRRKILGERHLDTLRSMRGLANVFSRKCQYENAERLQEQVLEILQNDMDKESPDLLDAMADLADTRSFLRKFENAMDLRRHVLASRQKRLGDNHMKTLVAMSDLADSYAETGLQSEAEQLSLQVLEATRAQFGDEHERTLAAMERLGTLYSDNLQRDGNDSYQLYRKVLEIHQRDLGPQHQDTILTMESTAYLNPLGTEDPGAEAMMLSVINWRETVLGPEHLDTIRAVHKLGMMFGIQGRFKEAETLGLRALSVREKCLGGRDVITLDTKELLGLTYCLAGEVERGKPFLREVLEGRESVLGPEHSLTVATREAYNRC